MHMEIDHLDSSLPYSITIDLEEFVTLDIAYYFAPAIEENSSTAEEEIPSSVLDVSVF